LDYLIKVRGMSFVEAVETVLGSGAAPVSVLPVEKPEAQREQKTLILPPPTRFPARMLSYLQNRGIRADVIRRCIDAGILFESRHNGFPVCVFVGKDDQGQARFACMRGITSDLKRDCPGSDKRYSFNLPARDPATKSAAVFESPIDVLSYCCLFSDSDTYYLSLGGTSQVALTAFLARNQQIDQVSLCLDADDAGQTAARKIQAALSADWRFAHITVSINPPINSKDYNDMLLQAKTQQRELAGRRKTAGISI